MFCSGGGGGDLPGPSIPAPPSPGVLKQWADLRSPSGGCSHRFLHNSRECPGACPGVRDAGTCAKVSALWVEGQQWPREIPAQYVYTQHVRIILGPRGRSRGVCLWGALQNPRRLGVPTVLEEVARRSRQSGTILSPTLNAGRWDSGFGLPTCHQEQGIPVPKGPWPTATPGRGAL